MLIAKESYINRVLEIFCAHCGQKEKLKRELNKWFKNEPENDTRENYDDIYDAFIKKHFFQTGGL